MPSLDVYKRQLTSMGGTLGQTAKRNSDLLMETTWDNDIQSKVCYIYDYFRDNDADQEYGFTYHNTTKHRIDAKFIVTQYGTISKDQVEYHLLLKPSQKLEFTLGDDLYWFEEEYRHPFNVQFPIGLYIDIPDEKGVYRRWIIVSHEIGNQFEKYSILPCDYRFQWIDLYDGKKVKRQMWGCTRSMKSYTAGLWIDRYMYSLDDVANLWIPLNSITQHFGYSNMIGQNQRICVSAKTPVPLTYKISKINNAKPVGIIQATLDQDNFNQHTDYVERDTEGNIVGMWANYYDNVVPPPDNHTVVADDIPKCELAAANQTLRIGGSYKTISASFSRNDEDLSNQYSSVAKTWGVYIDGKEITYTDLVTVKEDSAANMLKVKFANDRSYINKVITVRCTVDKSVGEIQLTLIA